MPKVTDDVRPDTAVQVTRWSAGTSSTCDDAVAEEMPVELRYNDIAHAVMMATPADLEDFGLGFSLTEGIVASAAELQSLQVHTDPDHARVSMRIPAQRMSALLERTRTLVGRTGCGLCGVQSLDQAVRPQGTIDDGVRLAHAELQATLATLRAAQPLNERTGSLHAAAWALPGQCIRHVREDVGRHNALDKVIGAIVRGGAAPADGYLIITSRASFEMVQKAAAVGISLLVAVSAPTALAIRMAADAGMTLVGFARPRQHTVYTHPQRLHAD